MSVNVRGSGLTPKQDQAARLVAEDRRPDREIAAQCGVAERTLERWKKLPAFMARVAEHREAWRDEELQKGIADRVERIRGYEDRRARLYRVMQARAEQHADVPGGDTGLLIRQVKLVKVYDAEAGDEPGTDVLYSAKKSVEVEEYAIDTGLLKELRDLERQAAQDLGQWTEKKELTGKDGGPIVVSLETLQERYAHARSQQTATDG